MDTNKNNQYSYKPFSIGPLIKHIVKEKRINRHQLAERLNIEKNSVYKIFNLKHPDILYLMRLSEALDENLLLEYHPNVKPKPNPLEAENLQLKTENTQLKAQVTALQNATEENKLLKAQLDVLKEMIKGKL